MIFIKILGLDEYITGRLSKQAGQAINKIIGNEDEEVFFYAPRSYIFHDGVEQTSWHAVTIINMPKDYAKYEEEIADYILEATKDYVLNMALYFEYVEGKVYTRASSDFPRFIGEQNLFNDDDYFEEDDLSEVDENTLYLGNIFEGYDFEEGKYVEDSKRGSCCEGDDDECCDDECDCDEDEDCSCND